VCEGASERGSARMLHTREKQTRRFAALSEHKHARVRLGVQCKHALMLCVWPEQKGMRVCVCVCVRATLIRVRENLYWHFLNFDCATICEKVHCT
jgi:hypothetical protein